MSISPARISALISTARRGVRRAVLRARQIFPMAEPASPVAPLLAGFVIAFGALTAVKAATEHVGFVGALGYVLAFLAIAGVVVALGAAFLKEAAAAREAGRAVATLERMTRALAGGRCGAWYFDPETRRLMLSRPLGAALGFGGEAHLALRDLLALIHADDARGFANYLLSDDAEEIRVRLKPRASEPWRSVRFRRTVGDDEHGANGAAFLTDDAPGVEDPARLKILLDSAAEAAALWSADGALIACNSRFAALLDLDDDAPDSLAELLGPPPAGEPNRIDACAAGGRWLQIRRRRTPDGGAIVAVADVTAIKSRDLTLKSQEQEIDRIAASLAKAERRADLAGRTKTEFLANMSHELRTPLNAINGFSQLIQSEPFGPLGDPRYNEYLDDILASGRRLLELVDDMLDMSKITAGEVRLNPRAVTLSEIVADVVEEAKASPEARRVSIRLTARGTPDAYADAAATRQAIAHIVSNAIKFAAKDGVVSIAVYSEADSAVVLVGDDGPGIGADVLARLGAPFELAEDHLSKTAQGAGLGLAIVRSLMEMQSGVFALASEPGAGALAALAFPSRKGAIARPPRALPPSGRILAAPAIDETPDAKVA